MTPTTLLLRSLGFYWRTHLGVMLGAALGAMVLTGSLLVGDSVKETLRRQALQRVGKAQSAMLSSERFFRSGSGDQNSTENDLVSAAHAAPALLLKGSVTRADAAARLNQVQVLGIDARFWALAPAATAESVNKSPLTLNRRAAEQLNVKIGDTLIVRVEKPSAFSRDAPLSGEENEVVAIRAAIGAIVGDDEYGRFGLQASQIPPFTIYLPLAELQKRLELAGRANLLLSADFNQQALRNTLADHWQLPDAGLQIRDLKGGGIELRTDRVFLDPALAAAAPKFPGKARVDALTYFVNELRAGDHTAPYSMATGVSTATAGFLPADLADGEIVINQWLAEDLSIAEGGKVTLKYFVMGERRQLTENSREFTVRAIIPMSDPQMNSTWMPDFPGLADKNNCRDWKPGFQFDSTRIRDKDQQYWEQYRGTPKAFVNLKASQEMWSNRWGDLTSIRWPSGTDTAAVMTQMRSKLTLEELGFQFVPLREDALAATNAPVDFGELFVSFSFFLLVAAAVLTGLLFVFSLEQRNREAGLLLALGLRPKQVRRHFLLEGTALSVIGSLLGLIGAIVYTKLVLRALATVWSGAVGGAQFAFSAEPITMAAGTLSSVLLALLAIWLSSRRQLRHVARELMNSSGGLEMARADAASGRSWSLWAGVMALLGAIGSLFAEHSAETFFSAGSLLLIAGLAFALAWLRRMARSESRMDSFNQFARRNVARRRGRSIATAAVLASGVFIVVAVDAFRQNPGHDAGQRKSGTGGFALVAESALPIYEDLNTSAGREAFALDDKALTDVKFVQARVREGDDASCLNLNRALQPRLLGINAGEMQQRDAFRFSAVLDEARKSDPKAGWSLLESPNADGTIPAITDDATLEWALQKKLGDTLEYRDERGQAFKVRLVATVAESMLQGMVFISEKHFIEKFPNQGGYRFFLIDAPAEKAAEIEKELSRGLADRGFEVTLSARRLAEFQAVENTYLSIFQALGGLGLLLGSLGLAIVVGRNVLERRSEFGLLEAVGFRSGQLRTLVFQEHCWLILCGLLIGVGSALVAVWPHLRSGFPLSEMAVLVAALTAGALFWTGLATWLALKGRRIEALRNE